MAKLAYLDQEFRGTDQITSALAKIGVPFSHWGKRGENLLEESQILPTYSSEINELKSRGGYVAADVVCLSSALPNLDELSAKFIREHHHSEDEVRFVVEGEGIFEIDDEKGNFAKLLTEAGDMVVVPQGRRHKFYLTESKMIRCIRLFKSKSGWEAIY